MPLFHALYAGMQTLTVSLLALLAPVAGEDSDEITPTPAPSLHQAQWVNATIPSCDNTCESAGLKAVVSGFGGNGEAFFVCAANAEGGGFRGGYNFRPLWANACYVGWGGSERAITPYNCLCQ